MPAAIPIINGEKACSGPCGQSKPLSAFAKKLDGYQPVCRQCKAAYARDWRAKNAERINAENRAYHQANRNARNDARRARYSAEANSASKRKQLFGVTVEQYNEMLEAQGGVCAICSREETRTNRGVIRSLSVDHDHETGRVRGLLCASCNVGVGMFGDDPDRLRAAIDYLTKED